MRTYLAINLAIIAGPLLLTFLPGFRFYRRWRPLLISILTVGLLFIIWDVLVTGLGHWAFNPRYVTGAKLLGLPIEEWLFFVTVPYSCLFLYEQMLTYLRDGEIAVNRRLFYWAALACLTGALLASDKGYTVLVLLATGAWCLSVPVYHQPLVSSRLYWAWIGIGMVLFFIFNAVLTALPVVTYGPNAILNLRVGTIPLEDFLYNFTLLTLYAAVYRRVRK
ncbi:MAG: lycopene cyclase domain-containing protein [Candidatus Margulisbacteria bacterium]|jgi:lycopene cyclase domain-containing protein|nr:lycopene cyclase domain-containing protein [Candidatus Margulisiibacteriota bacterium]